MRKVLTVLTALLLACTREMDEFRGMEKGEIRAGDPRDACNPLFPVARR